MENMPFVTSYVLLCSQRQAMLTHLHSPDHCSSAAHRSNMARLSMRNPAVCRVLQGARMGNISCRMAHSCSPTCFTVTMGAGPQLTLAIYTTRAVAQACSCHRHSSAVTRLTCLAMIVGAAFGVYPLAGMAGQRWA
jgi:hypothetical protein